MDGLALAAGCSSKPLQGSLLAQRRSITLGVRGEDFNLYREMHVAALKQRDLYANGEDLFGI